MLKESSVNLVNCVIGKEAKFGGFCNTKGYLRIDGELVGFVQAEGKVFISKSGRCYANVLGKTIEVSGTLKGNVVATEGVVIQSTGRVIGDIVTPHIRIEEGAFYKGLCRANPTIDMNKEITNFQKEQKKLEQSSFENVVPFEKKQNA